MFFVSFRFWFTSFICFFFFIFRLPRMYFVNCFYKFIGVKAFLTCCCCYCCRLLEARILFMCVCVCACVLNVVGALFWKRAKCETISLFPKFRLFLFSFANFADVFCLLCAFFIIITIVAVVVVTFAASDIFAGAFNSFLNKSNNVSASKSEKDEVFIPLRYYRYL